MENYEAPQLTFVGDAEDLILGTFGVGDDFRGEITVLEDEFETV